MRLGTVKRHAETALGFVGRASGVLMYHRVASESHDPWDLCVTPDHFDEQMSFLRRNADCVPLLSLAGELHWRRRTRVRVAVTFDDGYKDNLSNALPILERHGIPATIFVVSGQLGSVREFWWDALERCILRPSSLPERLALTVSGKQRTWSLRAETSSESDPTWRVDQEEARTDRKRMFLDLWEWLVKVPADARDRAMDELMLWAGVEPTPARQRLAVDAAELAELARHPLIQIGNHTRSHFRLTNLSEAEQRREVRQGKDDLEALLGVPVTAFSYPYGDNNRKLRRVVRDAAMQIACTSRPAPVTALSSRFAVPRLQVTDQGGAEFARSLGSHFPALRHERGRA